MKVLESICLECSFTFAWNWPKIKKKMTVTSQIVDLALLIIFTAAMCLLWSLVTGPSLMLLLLLVLELTIFVENGLTRNLEIQITLGWVLLYIWSFRLFRDINFLLKVLNEEFMNAAKYNRASL